MSMDNHKPVIGSPIAVRASMDESMTSQWQEGGILQNNRTLNQSQLLTNAQEILEPEKRSSYYRSTHGSGLISPLRGAGEELIRSPVKMGMTFSPKQSNKNPKVSVWDMMAIQDAIKFKEV
jgi:hypothetical protein